MVSVLEEAALEGVITCRECGNRIEPDCPECGECGWKNPLIELGAFGSETKAFYAKESVEQVIKDRRLK